ncbi:MAG: BMP family ABC transporter substrate-binding protein [Treponema sp.]|nr:BMP family ABC transporter substrate-binding protein [Treponema sp.]
MRKIVKNGIALPLLVLLFIVASCAGIRGSLQTTGIYELALIADTSSEYHNSFILGSWEGLYRFAKERNISSKLYSPKEDSQEALLEVIEQAIQNGARVIVCSGINFEVPVFIAQDKNPDVRFILVDSIPLSPDGSTYRTGINTASLLFAEDQAGFLAGYAAVKDGYRRLGFMGGMAVPSVIRFGYGFIQGAEYAAGQLQLPVGSVVIKYHYTGNFIESPQTQALAASWFSGGVEVIFACGGALGRSVMAAAEETGGKVIGVDVDQSIESQTVITSAMKGLQDSIYSVIAAFYAGRFKGGQAVVFSAANNGVGLPMETSRFNSFSADDYNVIFQKLVNGTIPRIVYLDSAGSLRRIPLTIVKIEEIL